MGEKSRRLAFGEADIKGRCSCDGRRWGRYAIRKAVEESELKIDSREIGGGRIGKR